MEKRVRIASPQPLGKMREVAPAGPCISRGQERVYELPVPSLRFGRKDLGKVLVALFLVIEIQA